MASQSSGSKSGNPLSHLGRKVFTTQRALAQILKQIRELDELPAATGRSAVKRAREQQLHDYDTPYGPIYIEPTLQKEDGFDVTIPSLSPAAMLHWACQHCAAFGQFLEKQMVLNPPTFAKNWTLAWYSDEVAPGNQLKHVNRRKVQVIYWSLKQLGSHAMTCGSCWFTLTVVRSTVVADMGGLVLNCPSGSRLLFADLGADLRSGAAPKDILHKRASTTAALSCSVSEALNFLQVLRTYVVFWVLPTCNEDMRNACETWLSLCMVLDVLQKIGMGKIVPPVELQRLIQTTLDLAKARYGADSFWVPKCHLALHLPLQLSRHSCLLSCFVHERKHKIVKKISNQVLDTSRTFEKSILDDVLHGHVQHLAECPAKLQKELREVVGHDADIRAAHQAVHGGNLPVAAKDLVVMEVDGSQVVGRVGYHVSINGACYSHLTVWPHAKGSVFTVSNEVALVETRLIQATCLFSLKNDSAIVVLP
ncbi:unnamed protein product [Symbiodinium microadriaticum]|nr:unnamed protein product [Symbiodinium sp. KB8]CAE7847902.1 unnamed protein product [Symbiodinium microadriaticum]